MAPPQKPSIDDTQNFMRWALAFTGGRAQLRGGEAVEEVQPEQKISTTQPEESRILSPIKEEPQSTHIPLKVEDATKPTPVLAATELDTKPIIAPDAATPVKKSSLVFNQDGQPGPSKTHVVVSVAHNSALAKAKDEDTRTPPLIGGRNLLDEPVPVKPLTPTQLKLMRMTKPNHEAVKAADALAKVTPPPQQIEPAKQDEADIEIVATPAPQSPVGTSTSQASTAQQQSYDTRMAFFDDKLASFKPISAQRVHSCELQKSKHATPQPETSVKGKEPATKFGVANLLQLQTVAIHSAEKEAPQQFAASLNPGAEDFYLQGQEIAVPTIPAEPEPTTETSPVAEVPATPVESSLPVTPVAEAQVTTENEAAGNASKGGIETTTTLQVPVAESSEVEAPAVTAATLATPQDNDTAAGGAQPDEEQGGSQQAEEDARTLAKEDEGKRELNTGKPKSRLIILKNLPKEDLDLTLVQSLIHGGLIESMTLSRDQGCAHVRFTKADDGWRYLLAYEGGIKFKHNSQDWTVTVDDGKDYEDVDATVEAYIECGASRVVRLQHVNIDVSPRILLLAAVGTHSQREVESMAESFRGGVRTAIFRFTSIVDAVMFRKNLLAAPQHWKPQHVLFMEDPCAARTTIDAEALA